MLEIEIKKGDITKVKADAIVNPANSFGWMGGGSAYAIKKAGGAEIEMEAVDRGPLEIGRAIATTAGSLPFKAVIHAPTMISPSEEAKPYNAQMAVHGALMLADDKEYKIVAMPGLGTGVGSLDKDEAAKVMIDVIKKFEPRKNLEKVILIDIDKDMVEAWEQVAKELK